MLLGIAGISIDAFLNGVTIILGLFVLLSLYRAAVGPTVFDRAAGVGLVGTKTTVLLVLIGFAYKRLDMFVDISLGYALLSFIGVIALARYFEHKGVDAW